jgi:biopolymer transport protein ExbB
MSYWILAQESANVTTESSNSESGVVETTTEIPLWDLIVSGGWYIMIPLGILSVLAVFIFVERFMAIQKATRGEKDFMPRVRQYIHEGKLDQARDLCRSTDNPVARMIDKGISKIGKPLKDISSSVENVGRLEVQKLEKRLSMLATIAGAAPMIGFLGTTIGMISSFNEMKALTSLSLDKIAPGMMQAMVTTVAGLIVGIIAYVAYNYLVSKVEKVIFNMEGSSLEFIDLLDEPGK